MEKCTISRRNFIKNSALTAAVTGLTLTTGCSTSAEKPLTRSKKRLSDKANILLITCDQLSFDAITANGNSHVSTPGIDQIVSGGTSFDATYCQFPLCSPSRASFWTGKLPHQTKVMANDARMIHNRTTTIGSLFSEAGYETKHFGKTHDFGSLRGFDVARENLEQAKEFPEAFPEHYQSKRDRVTVELATEYLQREHSDPFLLAVEFYNPHNINNWIGAFHGRFDRMPDMGVLPPLRANYQNNDLANRPDSIKYACCTTARQKQAAHWSEDNFRQYLKAYYHYTQMADDCVGRVLNALAKSDAADNTLIVFMSDHGDGMGSHKLVAKSHFFYDEAARVPFVMAGPGIPAGRRISSISGLCDLLPTLCDYSGITYPDDLYGKSLMPLLQSQEEPIDWRTSIVSQWHTLAERSIQPARMLRTRDFKYTHYLEDGGEELYDMSKDPGETRNLVNDPAYRSQLQAMRQEFSNYLEQTGDNYLSLKADPGKGTREHQLGYHHHA